MTKKKKSSKSAPVDPYANREAQNYDDPIVSREGIMAYLEELGTPASRPQIQEHFRLVTEAQQEALRRRLIAMTRDGQLICNRRGDYGLVRRMDLIRGRVSGHRDGFGFLIPEDGSDDLYLSARQMAQVFDGDIVLVREERGGRRDKREGVIVDVLERRTEELVGRLYSESGVAFVVPDNVKINQDIRIPEHALGGARSGQYVSVKLTRQPGFKKAPVGEVSEVLGEHMAPGMEIDVALRTYGIPFRFSEEVEAETGGLSTEIDQRATKGRVDLRHLPLVTIDGEDARDFDDAVYCEARKGGGWRLYVAIADVSHYVLPGTALDTSAYERGTSVYFPDRVVPMLPEVLSNGLCSLNPDTDRLCMVCEMTVSAAGRLSGYNFYEGVMRSQARLTYTQVGAFLDEPESATAQALVEKHGHLCEMLLNLFALYQALRDAREARGAIDFDTVETRILFDDTRKIREIVPVQRNDAHKLIEECMLCANVAAARLLEKMEIPALYRVHEGPSAEKLEKLRAFMGELGLQLGGGEKPKTRDYQALAETIRARPDSVSLQTVMLRSLSQAIYHPQNEGHFGLGYPAYTHFTSPIRRYPDLLVHRAIRSLIRSEVPCKHVVRPDDRPAQTKKTEYKLSVADLLVVGEHCSMTERRADEATRDVMAWLKCEFLQDRVGEAFTGRVTAVVAFGLFVELDDLYVEGLVHVSNLNSDYYHFDADRHRLVGERSGQTFRLGDEVEVRVAQVNLEDRKVDLELVQKRSRHEGRSGKAGNRSGAGGGKSRRDAILEEWNRDFEKEKRKGGPRGPERNADSSGRKASGKGGSKGAGKNSGQPGSKSGGKSAGAKKSGSHGGRGKARKGKPKA